MSASKPATQSKPSPITPRRVAMAVAGLLAIALIVANFQTTQVSLLLFHVNMPLAVLLAVMFGLGWLTCELMDKVARRRK